MNRIKSKLFFFISITSIIFCVTHQSFAKQLGDGLEYCIVNPIANFQILPNTVDIPTKIPDDQVKVVAAKGEFVPASIVFKPSHDIENFTVKITDLKNQDGDVIPASQVDIKIVKCWYQSGTQQGRGATPNNEGMRLLTPELLLNDDSLIKVDTKTKDNYIRCIDPDTGVVEYLCISKTHLRFPLDILEKMNRGLKESKTLVPTKLEQDENKQYWLTFHVPNRALPGVYKGKLEVVYNKQVQASIQVQLRVLGFRLPKPSTYYNPDKEFVLSMYYWGFVNRDNKTRLGARGRSQKQFRQELQNMYDHGVTNPLLLLDETQLFHDPHILRTMLHIRQEVGITGDLYTSEGRSIVLPQDEAGLQRMQHYLKKVLKIAREYGAKDVYFYGLDEAKGETLVAQRAMWNAIHEVGGKVFCSGYAGSNFDAMGDIQDLFNSAGVLSKAEAALWHSKGHDIFSYANPQCGLEAPYTYRKNYGLKLWTYNYDGAMDFCYTDPGPHGLWTDFLDTRNLGHVRSLTMAYPTLDGVIDTVQWEGYREGIDDIRYLCKLREEIKRAEISQDPLAKQAAEDARKYITDLDVEETELSLVRMEAIEHILKIQEAILVTGATEDIVEQSPPGLIASWDFDEGKGSVAKSSNSSAYNLEIVGAKYSPNKSGYELVFDGVGNYAELPRIDKLNFGKGDFSISFWIKPDKNSNGDIVSKWIYYLYGTNPTRGYRIALIKTTENQGQVRFSVGNNTSAGLTVGTSYSLYDGEYHHIACVRNKDALMIYIDGKLTNKVNGQNLDASAPEHLIVGRYFASVGVQMHYAGSLDDMCIYNYALDAEEIQSQQHQKKQLPVTK